MADQDEETPTQQAYAAADAEAADLAEPVAADLDVERGRVFESFGFARMRVEWRPHERAMLDRIKAMVDGVVLDHFADAFAIMSDLWDIVREPVVNEATGEVQRDNWGMTVWRRSTTGMFYEDYSRLTHKQREDFLYRITTLNFRWEQAAADLWGEAMFAKAQWTEVWAREYGSPMERKQDRIEDRTAVANVRSAEDRYFAIYTSWLSRKADAIVRSMQRIDQRLKDGMGN